MSGRIGCEYNIKDYDVFKVRVGTPDKRVLNVVYYEIETYMTPSSDIDDPRDFLVDFEKQAKQTLRNMLLLKKECFSDFIMVVEAAADRIRPCKPTFLTMQIFMKPREETVKTNKSNFRMVSGTVLRTYINDFMERVRTYMSDRGVLLSKTKHSPIYH